MKKILLAEVSPTIKNMVDAILDKNDYELFCTSDGLKALEIINKNNPDLLICGLGLSSLSGLDLIKKIIDNPQTGGIPILVLQEDKEIIPTEKIINLGVRGCLKKPFPANDLLELIEKHVHKKKNKAPQNQKNDDPANATNYDAKILSSTNKFKGDKDSVYNINLEASNETNALRPTKIKSEKENMDKSNEKNLEITADQYGLVPDESSEENKDPKDSKKNQKIDDLDEDYNWFVGEMNREFKDKSDDESTTEKDAIQESSNDKPKDSEKSDDKLNDSEKDELSDDDFDSLLQIPQLKISDDIDEVKETPIKNTNKLNSDFSETEIEKIADKITKKLVSKMIENIDKEFVVKAINEALKEDINIL